MGGTIIRATFSALVTPMLLGKSSTKKRVHAVSAIVPHVSPLAPKVDATTCVKIVVAFTNSNNNNTSSKSVVESEKKIFVDQRVRGARQSNSHNQITTPFVIRVDYVNLP